MAKRPTTRSLWVEDSILAILVDTDDLFTAMQLVDLVGIGRASGYPLVYAILRRLEARGLVEPCFGITQNVLWHASPEARAEAFASIAQLEEMVDGLS